MMGSYSWDHAIPHGFMETTMATKQFIDMTDAELKTLQKQKISLRYSLDMDLRTIRTIQKTRRMKKWDEAPLDTLAHKL
jgi:hypothetical protein